MKLKDLHETTKLSTVKIKLTDELTEQYANYSSEGESEVYLVGAMMGDWFISPQPPNDGKGERRIYPMPIGVEPSDFLECEIVE